jgi:YD repeat-containing protein
LRGRLTEVRRGRDVVEEYTYDANGNRISATIYDKTYQGDYNQDDQIVSYCELWQEQLYL